VNGKLHDNPLSDLAIHGVHPFPKDMEELLLRIDELGRAGGYWPLGENCPFEGREFDWEAGINLDDGRREIAHVLEQLEAGRADEVLFDPLTRRPFAQSGS
jgi:hypothetical protein